MAETPFGPPEFDEPASSPPGSPRRRERYVKSFSETGKAPPSPTGIPRPSPKSSPAADAPLEEPGPPFSVSASAPASKRLEEIARRRDPLPWIAALCVVALFLGGGGFVFYQSTAGGRARLEGPILQNPGRNYSLQLPSDQWTPNEGRKTAEGVDLVFLDPAGEASIAVKTGEDPKRTPTLGELRDQFVREMQSRVDGFEIVGETESRLAGLPSLRIVAHGHRGEEPVRLEADLFAAEGIWYRLSFAAPESKFAAHASEVRAIRESFRRLGPRAGWREPESASGAVFVGRSGPYRLRAPAGWNEVPELQTASRFADLKLAKGRANVVVSLRADAGPEAWERTYIARQKKMFPSTLVRGQPRELEVAGAPARQLDLVVDEPNEHFFLQTTFLRRGETTYQIECRAPSEEAAEFRPQFAIMLSSLEFTAPPTSPSAAAPTKPTASEPSKPAAPPPASSKTAPPPTTQETPAEKKPAAPPSPSSPKKDSKPAPKRKGLDDLE